MLAGGANQKRKYRRLAQNRPRGRPARADPLSTAPSPVSPDSPVTILKFASLLKIPVLLDC